MASAVMDRLLIARGVDRCSTAPVPAVDSALGRAAGASASTPPGCAWSKA